MSSTQERSVGPSRRVGHAGPHCVQARTRGRVLAALRALCQSVGPMSATRGWITVHALAHSAGLSRSSVGDHLRALQSAGLVEHRRTRGNTTEWRTR